MQGNPQPYEIYRHFKGKLYQIITTAENSEDGSHLVIYQQLYSPFKVYARPYDMFIELVDREKYPNAEQLYRFSLMNHEMLTDDSQPGKVDITPKVDEVAGEQADIDPMLMNFLDADTYERKLELLSVMHSHITQEQINTIAAALDIEVDAGDIETRYNEVRNCLVTMERFECNRLR